MLPDADKLKAFRKEYSYTQAALAEQLNLKQQQIAMIENGIRDASPNFKLAFIRTYGIDWDTQEKIKRIKSTYKKRRKDYANIISSFSKKLSLIQSKNKMDDLEMSSTLDISERRYEKLVLGKEKPYLEELINIVENFDISLDELLLDTEENDDNTKPSPIQDLSEKEMEIINLLRSKKLI